MSHATGNTGFNVASRAGVWSARDEHSLRLSWTSLAFVMLLLGYLCLGRSFAHVGLPPIYLGEVALVLFLSTCALAVFQPTVHGLVHSTPYSGLMWSLWLFLAFGFVQCVRGVGMGHHTVSALQNTVFHAYALFLFAGILLGHHCGKRMSRLVWLLATCHGVYGMVYILVLSPLGVTTEDELGPIPWFGQPNHAAAMLILLLAVENNARRLWLPLLANTFVLLAMQIRAEWLGLVIGMCLWGWMTGRVRQLAALTFGGVLLFGMWCVTDVKVPVPESRGGGEMGGRELIGRVIAAVDADTAAQFTKRADTEHGTVSWRTEWWKVICQRVHHSPGSALFGLGYGYPLWDLHPEGLDESIRTPHNAFIYALGYTGWLGLGVFVLFQFALGFALWRVFRRTGQAAGFCFWAVCLARATFDNFFEAPHFAIPYFIMIGLFLTPLLTETSDEGASPPQSPTPGRNP